MQFTIVSTLFLATAAIASPVAAPPAMEPADLVVRTGGGDGGKGGDTCSGDTKQVSHSIPPRLSPSADQS